MKVKNLNNSSVKTKKLIRNAFAELIQEHKELSKVTVSELVKRADINRGTFYNHYDSIYDVAEEFESEVFKVLLEDTKPLVSIEDIYVYLDDIISYLKENEEIYKLLLSSKEPLIFLERLKHSILDKLYIFLSTKTKLAKSNSLKFDITFYTDGIVNQVLKFFNGSSEYTLDEISAYSKRIFNILFNE